MLAYTEKVTLMLMMIAIFEVGTVGTILKEDKSVAKTKINTDNIMGCL